MAKIENGAIKYEENDLCGVGIFQTDRSDPFTNACRWHDLAYQKYKTTRTLSRAEVDKVFLEKCLEIAKRKKSFLLKQKAKLYYSLVRSFGWLAWNNKKNAL